MTTDPTLAALEARLTEDPCDDLARAAMADRCEKLGDDEKAAALRRALLVPPRLRTYDWEQAFEQGGTPDECPVGSGVPLAPFAREDVAEVLAAAEGENDGDDWEGVFRLRDGRFAFLSAGCDYTGWD